VPLRARAVAAALVAVHVAACAPGGAPGAADSPDPVPVDPVPRTEPSPEDLTPAPPTPSPTPTPAACDDPAGCYGEPRRVGAFDAETVPEASGLAASRRNPGVLYLLDDRPGTSEVWAIGTDGDMLGAITVSGLDARDTESLAVGPCAAGDPDACVYVGDIGDNLRRRADIRVHRFPEPDLGEAVTSRVEADSARLAYPDGAHDAEALIVDGAGALYILTKAPFDPDTGVTGETRLYRALELGDGVLEDLGPVPVPEPQLPLHSQVVGNVVTGADYLDWRVLVRTYDQVLEYRAPLAGADLATLADWPVRSLPSPLEPQSEAIAWAADGCGYYTAGEMVGDLWYVPCRP
jgi:hypothetical protein